jgi:predicted ATPase/DNA-binding CsgD family transcriptional regulator/Tfp pilus assembly protein PilF
VRRSGVRLLAFTGPAGIGKTRLALAVAEALAGDFPNGAAFADLAPIRDPGLVAHAIAQALGLRESPDQPLLEQLREYLRPRKILVLLDNFEQILDAAPQVATLLQVCPGLAVLVTSRSPLRLSWEHQFPVAALGLPDPSKEPTPRAVGRSAAVALFVARARSVIPNFAVNRVNARAVADVCAGLDGLPLALELAAARIGVLPPQAMAAELQRRLVLLSSGARDLPNRHQSLQAAFDWSHALLDPSERTLFRRLGVFVGGCAVDAAAAVCLDEADGEATVRAGLQGLVEKSMLRQDPGPGGQPRFSMLETVREYALQKLRESDDEAGIRDRHFNWCLQLAEQTQPQLAAPTARSALDRLDAEYDNLVGALEWVLAGKRSDPGLRLAGILGDFWWARGRIAEGRRWLEAVLAHSESVPTHDRARALGSAGSFAMAQGDDARGQTLLEESLTIRRTIADKPGMAASLIALGWAAIERGELPTARRRLDEALTISGELGIKRATANATSGLGRVAWLENDYRGARLRFEESLALFRELGNMRGIALELTRLGLLLQTQGDLAGARGLYEESLALFREAGDEVNIAQSQSTLAGVLLAQGEIGRAQALNRESLRAFRAGGYRTDIAAALTNLGEVALVQGNLDDAGALLKESLAIKRSLRDRWSLAYTLNMFGMQSISKGDLAGAHALLNESLLIQMDLGHKAEIASVLDTCACLAAASGHAARAARLFGQAEALREAVSVVPPPPLRRLRDQWVAATRARLSKGALQVAWAEGRALTLEQAAEQALVPPEPEAPRRPAATRRAPGDLTAREQEVASLIARGLTNRQIATELSITEGTAAIHVQHILNKLGFSSRAQVAAWASEHGLSGPRSG